MKADEIIAMADETILFLLGAFPCLVGNND